MLFLFCGELAQSFDKYTVATNSWDKIALPVNMEKPRGGCTALQTTYVFGGCRGAVYAYDVETATWSQRGFARGVQAVRAF